MVKTEHDSRNWQNRGMNTAIFGSAVQRTLKLSTRAFTHELAVFPLSGICGTGVSSAIILLQYEFQGSMTVRTQMAQVQVNTFLQSLSIIKHHSRTSLVGGAITILKNISQREGLSHILWKIKNVPNHQPDQCYEWTNIVGATCAAVPHCQGLWCRLKRRITDEDGRIQWIGLREKIRKTPCLTGKSMVSG